MKFCSHICLRIQTHGQTILYLFSGKAYAVVEHDIIITTLRRFITMDSVLQLYANIIIW